MRTKNKTRKYQKRKARKQRDSCMSSTSNAEMADENPCEIETSDSGDDVSYKNCMKLSTEVTSWQNQHQIAFWKSRALSLESENKMLYHVLRSVCCQRIKGSLNEYLTRNREDRERSNRETRDAKLRNRRNVPKKRRESKKEDGDNVSDLMANFDFEFRRNMLELYGQQNRPKIVGMETALQYSFDNNDRVLKPPFWPNIPFNV